MHAWIEYHLIAGLLVCSTIRTYYLTCMITANKLVEALSLICPIVMTIFNAIDKAHYIWWCAHTCMPVSQENLSPGNCVAATVFPQEIMSLTINVATVYLKEILSPGNTAARMLVIDN